MPVTPFHGGAGLLAKGLLGRRFSFVGFCTMQVVIDCESGYHLLRGDWPVHRFLHTFLGTTLACAAVGAALGWLGRRASRSAAPSESSGAMRRDLAAAALWAPALITIVAGVLGHVIPDGIMHVDVRPFAPLLDDNPFYGLLSLPVLHGALVVAGIVGLVLVLWRGQRVGTGRP